MARRTGTFDLLDGAKTLTPQCPYRNIQAVETLEASVPIGYGTLMRQPNPKMRHTYGREFRYSEWVPVVLALVAYGIFQLANIIPDFEFWNLGGLASFFSIFALLIYIFDRFLWRVLKVMGFLEIVDFEGDYEGEIAVGTQRSRYPAQLKIRQTWSKIVIEFSGEVSSGTSFSASIVRNRLGAQKLELTYNYFTFFRDPADQSKNHLGTAILEHCDDGRRLVGQYYTEKSRNSFGLMTLKRISGRRGKP